jgi:hypothetical protein
VRGERARRVADLARDLPIARRRTPLSRAANSGVYAA